MTTKQIRVRWEKSHRSLSKLFSCPARAGFRRGYPVAGILNVIMFLFQEVLDISIEEEIAPVKAKKHPRPPMVMTQSEVRRVLKEMKGIHLLMARLLYGGGLRLMECVRLRISKHRF